MTYRFVRLPLLAALSLALAAPALAQSGPPIPPPGAPPMGAVDADGRYYGNGMPDPRPEWRGPDARPYQQQPGGYDQGQYQQMRADWLHECRRNRSNGKTIGGAVIGGLLGGVIGNRIGGRGNRIEGTIAGAAVGAVAGGVLGSAADRRNAGDYCERYLDQHMGQQSGYAPQGYAYGYQPMTVMVPVLTQASGGAQRECTTTVTTEEFITETPSRAHRLIPPRRPALRRAAPVAHDKRVRVN